MNQILNVNTTKIDLSNQNLTKIPEEIFMLKNLKKLILRNNKIKVIPQEIEKLKRLNTLDLSGNDISNFYAKICSLKNLKILNLNNNKIKTFPIQIKNLNKLTCLHISHNKISEISEEIYNLQNLRELNISHNEITKIDNRLIKLKNLRKFWIGGLPLSVFPEHFFIPKSLICLYAFSSSITSYEADIKYQQLSSIKGNAINYFTDFNYDLNLHNDNPFKIEMKSIIKKNKIFISYSHKDSVWLDKVRNHINVLKNHLEINIEVWDDNKLEVGDVWKEEIKQSLEDAGIAIFLVSTDFLSSNFINKEEIPPILENAKSKGTIILPIILKVCYFEKSKLGKYQALNNPSQPFSKMSENEIDEHLVELIKKIHKIMEP